MTGGSGSLPALLALQEGVDDGFEGRVAVVRGVWKVILGPGAADAADLQL